MEITQDVYEAHQKLSNCSVHFLEYVKKNPGSLKRSNYPRLYGLNLDEGFVQCWPTFIDGGMKNILQEASTGIFKLIKSIPWRLFANDVEKMSKYYEVPMDIIREQLDGINYEYLENLVARADFIYSPSGFKCLEYNISAGIGGWQPAMMEPAYLATPLIANFLQEYNVKTCNRNLFEIYLTNFLNPAVRKFTGESEEINIAIQIPGYKNLIYKFLKIKEMLNPLYKKVLSSYPGYAHLQGDFILCDFDRLTTSSNGIYLDGKRIHVLIEMNQGILPAAVRDAFKAGQVLIYNGPVTNLLLHKSNLALFSELEDSSVFSPAEKELIKKYIPWTRKLIPGEVNLGNETFRLENAILSERERWVIKPSQGLKGDGVFIGRHTPEAQWREAVRIALKGKNWVVQEYIKSYPYLYQSGPNGCTVHHAVWGLFLFGPEYAGGFLRLLPREHDRGVINFYQGAQMCSLFEVQENGPNR